MTIDRVIRGGTLVDGTGAPPRRGDVGIEGGRIVALGEVTESARESIDAEGCWVTPGFIDPHTHLDAQLCWDPSGSPSNRHGVTSVIIGLCGFGVAPCPPGGGDYLLRSLERVEQIPYQCTREGVHFEWQSWREYRDHIARQPLAMNVAGYVPHSALRFFAMGDRASSEAANANDRAAMLAELSDALEAGAVGLATSRGPNHEDGNGRPVPSRFADAEELQTLVSACRGRVWQINVETKFSHDAAALTLEVDRYAEWSRQAGARLTWSPLYAEPGESVWRDVLAHNHGLNNGGLRVAPQITAVPVTLLLRFDERSFLTSVTGWEEALSGFFKGTKEERKARLRDPSVRRAMRERGGDPYHPLTPNYDLWTFSVVPTRPERSGRSLAELAKEENTHPVDLLCDQVIADDLATLLDVPVANRSQEGAIRFMEDDSTILALGDAGAHVMSVTNYRYPSFVLGDLVVRKKAISVERAVERMTRAPARLHGLRGRGVLELGSAADLCVIDPERVAVEPVDVRRDLPGNAPRLHQTGRGYRAVLVAGVPSIVNDEATGAAAGEMLRVTPDTAS
jgi:N-acyl-D-aspartate/D-glutamate deacylase